MLMHEPTQTVNSFWGQSQHAPATKWRSLGVTISREAGEVRARDLALLTALAALVTVGLAPSASPAPTSTTTAAASRLPPLSPAFIKEVNSLDSWTIVLATPQEAATATVPEMAAVATALHKDVTAARAVSRVPRRADRRSAPQGPAGLGRGHDPAQRGPCVPGRLRRCGHRQMARVCVRFDRRGASRDRLGSGQLPRGVMVPRRRPAGHPAWWRARWELQPAACCHRFRAGDGGT